MRAWDALVARLARVTSSGRTIEEIDGLRFVAISFVFMQHFQQALVSTAPHGPQPMPLWVLENAHFGVELFFVLSGFVLGLPFVRAHVQREPQVNSRGYFLGRETGKYFPGRETGKYFLRRLTRLEPPYILSLVLVGAYRILHPLVPVAPTKVLEHAVASLFYVHNWTHGPWHPRAVNTVTWSLEIEVQFYLLAPCLALVFRLPPWTRRAVIVGVSALASWAAAKLHWPLSFLLFLPYFGMGFILADLHLARWLEPSATQRLDGHVWDSVALLAAFLALMFSCTRGIPTDHTVLALLLFLVVFTSMRSRYVRAFLKSSPIRTIGGMCYSIYLLHWVLIWALWRWLAITPSASSAWQTLGMGTLLFIALLPVFALYFVLVEKPCMQPDWWRIRLV